MTEHNQGQPRTEQAIENRRITETARQRAHRVLEARYHDEYRRLLEKERRKLGYVPLSIGRPKKEDRD